MPVWKKLLKKLDLNSLLLMQNQHMIIPCLSFLSLSGNIQLMNRNYLI